MQKCRFLSNRRAPLLRLGQGGAKGKLHTYIVERIGMLTVYTDLKMAVISVSIAGSADISDGLTLLYLVTHAYCAA